MKSIEVTLAGTTTQDQSGSGSNGQERLIHILQSNWIGASPSDSLVPYSEHSLVRVLLSVEMHSTAPADRVV